MLNCCRVVKFDRRSDESEQKLSRMNLTHKPDIQWPATHYIFIELEGPFQETAPAAWGKLHGALPSLSAAPTGFLSLYKPAQYVYRAGVSVAEKPEDLPEGLKYELFPGGKYACFELIGSYVQMPEACGKAHGQVPQEARRDDFFLENYCNDPRVTPEAELLTQILVPLA